MKRSRDAVKGSKDGLERSGNKVKKSECDVNRNGARI
jgi:hypothetical protein